MFIVWKHYVYWGFSCGAKGAYHFCAWGCTIGVSVTSSRSPHSTVMSVYVHWYVGVVCRNGRLSQSPVTMVTAMNLQGPIDHSYLTELVMQPNLYCIYTFLVFRVPFPEDPATLNSQILQQYVARNISRGEKLIYPGAYIPLVYCTRKYHRECASY